MAKQDCNSTEAVTEKDVPGNVTARMEQVLLSCCAMDDLCMEEIAKGHPGNGAFLVVLRDFLRSTARDAENCAVALSGNRNTIGYFEDHFGAI
ncbi:hypothetical protein [Caballeronia sp. dw_276]|uniref:hypothetical protein n=1 Tax=Caballeronia sp. dw_276 TaxID=2719795 RepID=UPI001BD25FEB|nr:hypothetical protein [Caballeronia sp. dw_276]